jgi:hypothetical protein
MVVEVLELVELMVADEVVPSPGTCSKDLAVSVVEVTIVGLIDGPLPSEKGKVPVPHPQRVATRRLSPRSARGKARLTLDLDTPFLLGPALHRARPFEVFASIMSRRERLVWWQLGHG